MELWSNDNMWPGFKYRYGLHTPIYVYVYVRLMYACLYTHALLCTYVCV